VVERAGDAAVTTFVVEHLAGESIDLGEDAAHHARVKRLEPGDEVALTDGKGARGIGRIASITKRALVVEIGDVTAIAPPPEINLFVPVADKERMLWVAEKATELQITSWNPVMYERSRSVSPRGEGEAFDRKVEARMMAALEQSGGSWLPVINGIQTIDDLAKTKGVVLERDSNPFGRWTTTPPVNLAAGPEGGFSPGELDRLLAAGWSAASFGDVTLRFETAAIGAVAVLRAMMN
jgi:16S rRNA (uracil1498-N3)-methyltransferase